MRQGAIAVGAGASSLFGNADIHKILADISHPDYHQDGNNQADDIEQIDALQRCGDPQRHQGYYPPDGHQDQSQGKQNPGCPLRTDADRGDGNGGSYQLQNDGN